MTAHLAVIGHGSPETVKTTTFDLQLDLGSTSKLSTLSHPLSINAVTIPKMPSFAPTGSDTPLVRISGSSGLIRTIAQCADSLSCRQVGIAVPAPISITTGLDSLRSQAQ